MILIFSEDSDNITNLVIDWLQFKKTQFIRVNDIEFDYLKLNFSNSKSNLFSVKINSININQIKSIWFRRTNYFSTIELPNNITNSKLKNYIATHLLSEKRILLEYIFNSYFDKNKKLGLAGEFQINKLITLKYALELGLKIPDTIITNKASSIEEFYNQYNSIITKSINDVFFFIDKKSIKYSETEKIELNDIDKNNVKTSFFPSLFQDKIEKKIEIRSFFLNDKIYSMAIFTQENKNSKIDSRNYSLNNKNREVPFLLPENIEKKLIKLFLKLNLNIGVADLIYSKDNKFYFLEINPNGQFEDISNIGNYYLEEKIANQLIQ
jgi:ATP-GRASP peptide maturase of grasp-with-spasm system